MISEGDCFKTFKEFETKLTYREEIFNEKWIKSRSCHSVKYTNAGIKGPFKWPEEIEYTSVNFVCKHFGEFKSRSKTRESTSRKQGCPAVIKLRSDKSNLCLKITEVNLQHLHQLAPKSDGIYPDDRKLTPKKEAEVRRMIGNRVAVSKIIDDVLFTHKVPLVPRDIHNLRAKMQKEKAAGQGQVWAQLQKMVDDDAGAHFSAFAQDGIISIIFFQTSHMRRLLQTYPEVLFIDTTYCLNAYKYPVVVFMVVDGDNKGHCVGYSIVRDERLITFAVIFHEFILKNDFLKSNLKTVVVDKDGSEIGAIKLAMPHARVLLCRFHVRKALNANVDSLCAKSKREEMKETVRKLVWTDKEEKFMEAYATC